jgi:hypothetical protein
MRQYWSPPRHTGIMVSLASTGQLTTTTMEFFDIALQEDKHKNNNEK